MMTLLHPNVEKGKMMIRIAVIGSEQLIRHVLKTKKDDVELVPCIYKTPEEAPALVKEVKNNIHVLFFAGPIPYFLSQQEIQKSGLPSVYIPSDEYSIILSLYHIRYILQEETKSISIDISDQDYVYNVFDELDISKDSLFVKEYEGNYNLGSLVAFHYNLWKQGKVDFVLTSVEAVYVKLNELGVKSMHIIKPQKNISDALDRAIDQGKIRNSKKAQIVVGLVTIEDPSCSFHNAENELHHNPSMKAYQILKEFVKKINASVLQLEKNQFILYATRGAIEKITNGYSELPIAAEMEKRLEVSISFGFGFGLTTKEAQENANIALYHSRHSVQGKAYVVTDKKVVIGPLDSQPQQYALRSMDEDILSISKKTGISVSNVSKIVEFLNFRNFDHFSANDLSDYLHLSKRSAERMLKKLLDHHLAQIVGEEQPYQKGRPRSIYKVNF
jgi:hypothetical protein